MFQIFYEIYDHQLLKTFKALKSETPKAVGFY